MAAPSHLTWAGGVVLSWDRSGHSPERASRALSGGQGGPREGLLLCHQHPPRRTGAGARPWEHRKRVSACECTAPAGLFPKFQKWPRALAVVRSAPGLSGRLSVWAFLSAQQPRQQGLGMRLAWGGDLSPRSEMSTTEGRTPGSQTRGQNTGTRTPAAWRSHLLENTPRCVVLAVYLEASGIVQNSSVDPESRTRPWLLFHTR